MTAKKTTKRTKKGTDALYLRLPFSRSEMRDFKDAALDSGLKIEEWARLCLLMASGRAHALPEHLERAAQAGVKLMEAAMGGLDEGLTRAEVAAERLAASVDSFATSLEEAPELYVGDSANAERFEFRAPAAEVDEWRRLAKASGLSLSAWLRRGARAALEASPTPEYHPLSQPSRCRQCPTSHANSAMRDVLKGRKS